MKFSAKIRCCVRQSTSGRNLILSTNFGENLMMSILFGTKIALIGEVVGKR